MTAWNRDVGDIIAEIKMMVTDFSGFFWILEGPSDQKFFNSRVDKNISLIVAGGKRNVINAVKKLEVDTEKVKVLGIVDADIEWLIPIQDRPINLISTEPRDLEGMLLRSSAFHKVLAEYADAKKIQTFEKKINKSLLMHIHDSATLFGKIRAVNDIHNRTLLKKFRPQCALVKGAWLYDPEVAFRIAVNYGVSESVDTLKREINELPNANNWYYVRGHDAVNILTAGLLSEITNGTFVDDARVDSVLRAGFEEHEYQASSLYKSLNEWSFGTMEGA